MSYIVGPKHDTVGPIAVHIGERRPATGIVQKLISISWCSPVVVQHGGQTRYPHICISRDYNTPSHGSRVIALA